MSTDYLIIVAPINNVNIEESLESRVTALLNEGWSCLGQPMAIHEGILGKVESRYTQIQKYKEYYDGNGKYLRKEFSHTESQFSHFDIDAEVVISLAQAMVREASISGCGFKPKETDEIQNEIIGMTATV